MSKSGRSAPSSSHHSAAVSASVALSSSAAALKRAKAEEKMTKWKNTLQAKQNKEGKKNLCSHVCFL